MLGVRRAVQLVEDRVVNTLPQKRIYNRQVEIEAIGSQLDSVLKPPPEIIDKRVRVDEGPLPNQPRWNELGVSIDGYPCPNVPVSRRALELLGDVLLLGVAEAPNLVTLDGRGVEVAKGEVLILSTGLSEIDQEFGNGVLGSSGDANSSANAHPFDQTGDDLACPLGAQPVTHND